MDRTFTCLSALVGPSNPVKLKIDNKTCGSGWSLKPQLSKVFEFVSDFSSKQSFSGISFSIFFIFLYFL
jgi:hypothetical protein